MTSRGARRHAFPLPPGPSLCQCVYRAVDVLGRLCVAMLMEDEREGQPHASIYAFIACAAATSQHLTPSCGTEHHSDQCRSSPFGHNCRAAWHDDESPRRLLAAAAADDCCWFARSPKGTTFVKPTPSHRRLRHKTSVLRRVLPEAAARGPDLLQRTHRTQGLHLRSKPSREAVNSTVDKNARVEEPAGRLRGCVIAPYKVAARVDWRGLAGGRWTPRIMASYGRRARSGARRTPNPSG